MAAPAREEVAARLRRSPFHRWLDLALEDASAEGVVISMPWRDEIVSRTEPVPFVHGGVLGALIDLAGLHAVYAAGGHPNGTAYCHIDYHRPATSGPLTARARVLRLGRTLSTAETFVYGPDGALLASGRGGYPCAPAG